MDTIVYWLVVAMSMLIINNNCLARKLLQQDDTGVSLNITSNYVEIQNRFMKLTIANPEGFITRIRYNGVDNWLEHENSESNRGYFDIVWNSPGKCRTKTSICCVDKAKGQKFEVISNGPDRSEISFSTRWNSTSWNTPNPKPPLNFDKRYVMLKGLQGFYSYTILERDAGYPSAKFHQIRSVYKLNQNRFHFMAISDDRQRLMPMPEDRLRGEKLAYKEAIRLTNPVDPNMMGEVDDKYQYSSEGWNIKLHGWTSKRKVGFWLITPSNEFRTAGPFKQDLTGHVGPTLLQTFHSAHYGGRHMAIEFRTGEPWKKVLGPFLVYMNYKKDNNALWLDAKRQMEQERKNWPYDFPLSMDYAKPMDRGSVSGRLIVNDSFGKRASVLAANAWVGLAAVGFAGSWQRENKGYQFWVQANENGSFIIKGVVAATYSLYATVPGFMGDYKFATDIVIAPGVWTRLGNLTYEPPRIGPTLWEIGIPDRSAAEFFVPNPIPTEVNKLFVNKPLHNFRQYGLWEQCSQFYSTNDLVYIVGKSDYRKDWFFAHIPRRNGTSLQESTWQIVFPLARPKGGTTYTLRIATAAATNAEVQVRFNNRAKENPDFTTKLFGKDNAIARHGIHGMYHTFRVDVPSSNLRLGSNTIYLTQTRCKSIFNGVMYDYIRFEGPEEIV